MGKSLIKILILLMLQACVIFQAIEVGKETPTKMAHQSINPKLKKYLDDFERDGAREGVAVNKNLMAVMQFGQLSEEGNVGWCYFNSSENRFNPLLNRTAILFLDERFEADIEKPDCLLKALVYHELGHCLLARYHDGSRYWTIMGEWPYPEPGSDLYKEMNEYFCKNWKPLVNDLFTRSDDKQPSERFKK